MPAQASTFRRRALLATTALAAGALFSFFSSEIFVRGAELQIPSPPEGLGPRLRFMAWILTLWWQYTWATVTAGWPLDVVVRAAEWLALGALGGLVGTTPAIAFAVQALVGDEGPKLHGSARWATDEEIRSARLREPHDSIIVAQDDKGFLALGGQESVAVYAPPRSGKTAGVAIPNAMLFDGSIVVVDIKGEIYDASAGLRASAGQAVFRFEPLSQTGSTHRWNPLDTVRRGTVDCHQDLDRIAHMLIPDPPAGATGSAGFFAKAARVGFVGVGMLLAETEGAAFTLTDIARILTRPDVKSYIETRLTTRRVAGQPHTRACADACRAFIAAPPETFQNVVQTISAEIGLFLNPRVAVATSTSDFDLRQLRRHHHAIYLVTRDEDLDTLRPLTAVFFQSLLGGLTTTLPAYAPEERHQVLLILDEFVRLGRMPRLASAANFVAGYNIRLLIIMQDRRTPEEHYGISGAKVLINACGAEVVLRTKDLEMAKMISERVGSDTVDAVSVSRSHRPGAFTANRSETTSDRGRPLLLPQEVTALPEDTTLVFRAGFPAIKAKRIAWYADPRFARWRLPPPATPSLNVAVEYDGDALPDTDEAEDEQSDLAALWEARARSDAADAAEAISAEITAFVSSLPTTPLR